MHGLILSEHLATKPVVHLCLWAFTFRFSLCSAPFSWFCAELLTVLGVLFWGEGVSVLFFTGKRWEPPSSNWGAGESWSLQQESLCQLWPFRVPVGCQVTLKEEMCRDRLIHAYTPSTGCFLQQGKVLKIQMISSMCQCACMLWRFRLHRGHPAHSSETDLPCQGLCAGLEKCACCGQSCCRGGCCGVLMASPALSGYRGLCAHFELAGVVLK